MMDVLVFLFLFSFFGDQAARVYLNGRCASPALLFDDSTENEALLSEIQARVDAYWAAVE